MKALNLFTVLIVLITSLSLNSCNEDNFIQKVEIKFPDSNLEQAIRDAINKPEGAIFLEDINLLEELVLNEYNIVNLSGIENFTNLTHLEIGGNSISDLSPLASLTNLNYLELSHNEISNLSPLANLTSLIFLNLRNNDIEDITPLSSLTNLTELFLCSNYIDNLSPVNSLINLQMLTLINNLIKDLAPLCGLGIDFSGTIAFHTIEYLLGFTDEQKDHLHKCLPNAIISVSGDII